MDIIVIGAGAAGSMAAGVAGSFGKSVLLIERNDKIGRKLMITGKGRCNLTNDCRDINELIENVPSNGRFLYSAFRNFMPSDTMEFFNNLGVRLKTERGSRVFPESDKASDIVDALDRFLKRTGVTRIKARITDLKLENDNKVEYVTDESGKKYKASKYIIATGGASYPSTGSTGDGYNLAKLAGHTVTPLKPALVPLETSDFWTGSLSGLSLKNVSISAFEKNTGKKIYSDFGEALFTHFGMSGPVILSLSCHLDFNSKKDRDKYILEIDLKPALSEEKLNSRILRDFSENKNKSIINVLPLLLPKKLVPVALSILNIPYDLKVNQATREQRQSLVNLLKHFTVHIKGFRPIEEAIVTSGGVNVKEISPKTMKSKICENLYFAGEVIDVSAYTGGFNLQTAFSTGVLAGKSAATD